MVEAYNTNAGALTSAAVQAIRGSMALNAQLSGLKTDNNVDDIPNSRIVDKTFSDAVFNRLRYDQEMGMLDDTKENFKTVIESIPNSDIASDMNMTDEQVNEYKSNLVGEFNKKVDNFTIPADLPTPLPMVYPIDHLTPTSLTWLITVLRLRIIWMISPIS